MFAFCLSLWKQFCLQQFITQAIETLMYCVLEVVGRETSGLKMDEIISSLLQPGFFDSLKESVGKRCHSPLALLESLGVDKIPTQESSREMQKKIRYFHPLSEIQILENDVNTPEATASKAVLLLAVLYGKWRGIREDQGYQYVAGHAGNELWAGSVLRALDNWVSGELRWEDALSTMIKVYVIDQHDCIMYQKRRLDSCWIHHIEGRIFKDQDYAPGWRSSRHTNCVRILHDLGYLEIDSSGSISVSPDGRKLLRSVET
jgi:hypothetical protein